MQDQMRLLLTGDIHIGRSSTRVGDDPRDDDLRAAAAWSRLVDCAIRDRCDLVVLSGDVTDKANAYFEAIGPLRRGVERLAAHGIRTIAVSGNHDWSVLARLADALPEEHFTLVGRDGRWERVTIRDERGHARLHIDGWSFLSERVQASPLDSYELTAATDAPMLGLVHGDLDVPTSIYAPLSRSRMIALPPHAWLLGHIHAPSLRTDQPGDAWMLYPGSPQALDFGEPGVHGAWRCDVEAGRLTTPEHVPLSTVRYETVSVDVAAVADADRMETRLFDALRGAARRFVEESGDVLSHVALRLRVTGETELDAAVAASIDSLQRNPVQEIDGLVVTIDRITDETTPRIDLLDAARSPSPLGIVARVLLHLGDDAEPMPASATVDAQFAAAIDTLIGRTRRSIDDVRRQREYGHLTTEEATEREARDHLRREALRLLRELARQVPSATTTPEPDDAESLSSTMEQSS